MMIVKMDFLRSTKNKHRYDTKDPAAPFHEIYINHGALKNPPPLSVLVTVREFE